MIGRLLRMKLTLDTMEGKRNLTSYQFVVIPVYNRIDKLSKTMAAITHQTYPHELIEIVIADDGSSDNPDSLIPLFEKYFTINYISQPDEGYRLSEIRNKGVATASHSNIIILDCDMLPEPTLIESLHAVCACQ